MSGNSRSGVVTRVYLLNLEAILISSPPLARC